MAPSAFDRAVINCALWRDRGPESLASSGEGSLCWVLKNGPAPSPTATAEGDGYDWAVCMFGEPFCSILTGVESVLRERRVAVDGEIQPMARLVSNVGGTVERAGERLWSKGGGEDESE